MRTVYSTIATGVGNLVSELMKDKILILFKDNAPDALFDYCVFHNENSLKDNIVSGDILIIGNEEYIITAVGKDAVENLDNLGHVTFKFDGNNEAKLPGTIHVEDKMIKDINVGTEIKIVRG
ncbi:PTS glucitol/sorbitol transporter subunit IIA [Tepidimicrobium xylanilyticum]|uniref:PTS glucitol/sorbitol transporter subunit IIA n=1 Tax=Tepidimicrobium xylanilyticum TaxID=1123352 RepID=UPI0026529A7A|nr:PTS glucitol/sorbitol transporter subunit IIA [Tepidimicrobium xylanilyticum]GMG95434.1 PTS sorbitol transporter subunit IIA [Tepidimicrobium xylanilyticum]